MLYAAAGFLVLFALGLLVAARYGRLSLASDIWPPSKKTRILRWVWLLVAMTLIYLGAMYWAVASYKPPPEISRELRSPFMPLLDLSAVVFSDFYFRDIADTNGEKRSEAFAA